MRRCESDIKRALMMVARIYYFFYTCSQQTNEHIKPVRNFLHGSCVQNCWKITKNKKQVQTRRKIPQRESLCAFLPPNRVSGALTDPVLLDGTRVEKRGGERQPVLWLLIAFPLHHPRFSRFFIVASMRQKKNNKKKQREQKNSEKQKKRTKKKDKRTLTVKKDF